MVGQHAQRSHHGAARHLAVLQVPLVRANAIEIAQAKISASSEKNKLTHSQLIIHNVDFVVGMQTRSQCVELNTSKIQIGRDSSRETTRTQ